MIPSFQPDLKSLYPVRLNDVHKGDCGRVGVLAGSVRMAGAAILTAMAAIKSGAGLVYLFTVEELVPYINIAYPELICVPLKSRDGFLSLENENFLVDEIKKLRCDCLAVGPGMGRHDEVQDLISRMIPRLNHIPVVLDADALFVLSALDLKKMDQSLVITPHMGEFDHLFSKLPFYDERLSKKELAYHAFDWLGKTVVLKGTGTCIASQKGVYVNQTGNSGMATAGSGDVLTGVLVRFMAEGLPAFEASVLAVYLHGLAGDLAYSLYDDGLVAGHIIDQLGSAIKKLKG